MDLGLEDEIAFGDIEILGDFECLVWSGGDVSALDEDSVFAHEVFGLVLVEIEEAAHGGGELPAEKGTNYS